MGGHRGCRAKNDELHAGTRYGYVHAAEVAQEAYVARWIVAHEGDEHNVTLLSLEAVDGVDCYGAAVGTEKLALLEHLAQQLHLSTIGRDDAYVD